MITAKSKRKIKRGTRKQIVCQCCQGQVKSNRGVEIISKTPVNGERQREGDHRKSSSSSSSYCTEFNCRPNSLVSLAISNAMGGSLLVTSRSFWGLVAVSPSLAVSIRRPRFSSKVWMIGPDRSRSAGLTSGLYMMCSVEEETFVTTVEMAERWVLIMARPSSARMLATRAWMDWTRPSVWSST